MLPSGITNCQQFIGVADWFPTLCAAAGVQPRNTAPFDGLNLWPQLLRATNGWLAADFRPSPLVAGSSAGSAVFGLYPQDGATSVFKLIRSKQPAGAGGGFAQNLFDILKDPLEQTDLIGQAAFAPVVSSLAAVHDAIKPESYTPSIGVQPEGATVSAGAPVTLWAMATIYAKGARAQWYRNGVPLSGVTNMTLVDTSVYLSRLDLPAVTAADAGNYEVEFAATTVGWPASVRSRGAVLTVAGGGGEEPPTHRRVRWFTMSCWGDRRTVRSPSTCWPDPTSPRPSSTERIPGPIRSAPSHGRCLPECRRCSRWTP